MRPATICPSCCPSEPSRMPVGTARSWDVAVACALDAARDPWRPGVVVQILVAALVASALPWPAVDAFWQRAGAALTAGGLPAVFLTAGLTSGLLAEAAVVAMHQGGRWTAANVQEAGFRFLLYGVNAVLVSL